MRPFSLWFGVVALAICQGSGAQESAKTKKSPPANATAGSTAKVSAPATRQADDAKAIAALVASFTKAFNAGDAAAAAATYAEDALVVDEQGERTEGRAAIRDRYAASFADNPGSTIAIQVDSLRFLGPETALEEGRATITPADGAGLPEITRFTAVYVKQGGRWLQSAVRDELAQDLTPHDRLKELEWLVGDWVNESQDAVVAHHLQMGRRRQLPGPRVHDEDARRARALGHAADRLGPAQRRVQDLDLRLRGGPRRGVLDPRRRPVGDQGRGRRPGRPARVGDEHHHAAGQGPDELAVGRPDPRRRRDRPGSTSSSWSASHPRSASSTQHTFIDPSSLSKDRIHDSTSRETGPGPASGLSPFRRTSSPAAAAVAAAAAVGGGGGYGGGGGGGGGGGRWRRWLRRWRRRWRQRGGGGYGGGGMSRWRWRRRWDEPLSVIQPATPSVG